MKRFFSNITLIDANLGVVTKVLLQAEDWIEWNPAITSIQKIKTDVFAIHRDGAAINPDEIIEIEYTTQKVIYHSTGGTLKYRLIFELFFEDGQTKLVETCYIPEQSNLFLLSPIAKRAFKQNLSALKRLTEQIQSSMTKL